MSQNTGQNILVIKLGALGDFIQALGPMKAIRAHHPDAKITLMTTKAFRDLGEKSGYFDEIWFKNTRPKSLDISAWLKLRQKFINENYARVYDLQNNDRTRIYMNLIPKSKRPEWVGAAKGADIRNASPSRIAGHAFDGHKQTLALAGINNIEIDTLDWIQEDISAFPLTKPYILFVPGCAPQHPQKRWPSSHYADLAKRLSEQGYQIALLGTPAEKEATDYIADVCQNSILDLNGKTSLLQIITLAQNAAGAVGNDTGPMHMIAPTGCPSIVLFSANSNPKRHAPLGAHVLTLQKDNLENLSVDEVLKSTHFFRK